MSTQALGSFFSRWVWGPESNMLLYYLVLRVWLGIVSWIGVAPTEVMLRLPSAFFAVGAAVVVFELGRRLFGRLAGVVAALLFTTNFLQMILAQNARAYSLQLLLLGLSWLALFAGLEGNRAGDWIGYVAATALSVYADLFSGLVIFSQVVAIAALLVLPGPWQRRVRVARRSIAVSLAVSFVLVLPILGDAIVHGGPVWVPPAHLSDLKAFLKLLTGSNYLYTFAVFGTAAFGVAVAAAGSKSQWQRFVRSTERHLGIALALGSWFLIPIVVSFALTRQGLNLHLFFPRYLVVVVPPLVLLAGLGVSAIKLRVVQAAAVVAVLITAFPPLSFYYGLAQVQDVRTPAAWLQARYQAGDGIVCDPVIQCAIPVAYYFIAYPGPAHLDADSPGLFNWESNRSLPVSSDALTAFASHHQRIFVIYAPLGAIGAQDPELSALQTEMTGLGYSLEGQTESRANGADTVVMLFQRR